MNATGPGEFDLIERIRQLLPDAGDTVVVPPGDDCAAVRVAPGRLQLLTCDALVEGRHFRREWTTPYRLGRKLAAINLSDVAAMGGRPQYALVSLAVPSADAGDWVEEIARGTAEGLAAYGAAVVGGNLSGSDGDIVADLALVGEVSEDRVLRRAGARPGDAVLVTGSLGDAAAGLALLAAGLGGRAEFRGLIDALLLPVARIEAGLAMAGSGAVHSAIDVSDGLASDLGHLCRESGVAAEIRWNALPLSEAAVAAAVVTGRDPARFAVAGGEDYELLLTAPPDAVPQLRELAGEAGLTEIGSIVEGRPAVRFVAGDGSPIDPGAVGWDHFA